MLTTLTAFNSVMYITRFFPFSHSLIVNLVPNQSVDVVSSHLLFKLRKEMLTKQNKVNNGMILRVFFLSDS
jgi:hypothetical protein